MFYLTFIRRTFYPKVRRKFLNSYQKHGVRVAHRVLRARRLVPFVLRKKRPQPRYGYVRVRLTLFVRLPLGVVNHANDDYRQLAHPKRLVLHLDGVAPLPLVALPLLLFVPPFQIHPVPPLLPLF